MIFEYLMVITDHKYNFLINVKQQQFEKKSMDTNE